MASKPPSKPVGWQWENSRDEMRTAIRKGVERARWACQFCGKKQVGGRHPTPTGMARICQFCREEQSEP
jgi:hypothetical protein